MQIPGQKSFGVATTFADEITTPLTLLLIVLGVGASILVIDRFFLGSKYTKAFVRKLK